MAFNELDLKRIDKFIGGICRRRTRREHADELRFDYRIEGQSLILYEERSGWRDPDELIQSPFAKLRYVRTTGLWTLYWMRADLKWHAYGPVPPTADLAALVDVVDEDAYSAFFG